MWWKYVLPLVPDLIRSASGLAKIASREKQRRPGPGGTSSAGELARDIRNLKDELAKNEELVRNMSKQIELLSLGVKSAAIRAVIALFIALLSLAALVTVLIVK